MKRFWAFLLAVICCATGCFAPARAEEADALPALNLDVALTEAYDDGRARVRITVYWFAGKGKYEQSRMENLRVTLNCKNGLETEQTEFRLGSPSAFQQVFADLTYKGPGGSLYPDSIKTHRPILEVHATTLNCGEADYTCYFDARAKARAFTLYYNDGMGSADAIRNSSLLAYDIFGHMKYQYSAAEAYPPFDNPHDIMTAIRSIGSGYGIQDNDITYIHIACHGSETNAQHPDGAIAFPTYVNGQRRYPAMEDVLLEIERCVKGRVVVILDCCFSGAIVDAAKANSVDGDRFCVISATTAALSEPGTNAALYSMGFDSQYFTLMMYAYASLPIRAKDCQGLIRFAHVMSFFGNQAAYVLASLVYGLVNGILYAATVESKIAQWAEGLAAADSLTDYAATLYDILKSAQGTLLLKPDELEALLQQPLVYSFPTIYGGTGFTLFTTDETYDDGYHLLIVYDDETRLSAPRYVTARTLDQETKEAVPGANVTVWDEDGFSLADASDADGRWARVLTDKTIRLDFEKPEYEKEQKLLGNGRTAAALTEGVEDPQKAAELVEGIETSSDFPVYMKRSVARFYIYLRDHVAPEIGVVSGEGVYPRPYKLADDMAAQSSGLISAAVCDFNGDGRDEMIAVTAGEASGQHARYAYRLQLYGLSEDGRVEPWDTAERAAYAESETGSGMLSAHAQRSEGTVYVICDANIENYTSSDWSYATSRVYRVDGKKLTDVTDYEGFLRGNSGVSLHRQDREDTALCRADMQWAYCRTVDYTHLDEYLRDADGARRYQPVALDLDAYDEARAITRAPVDRLVGDIESGVCAVVHVSTSVAQGGAATEYRYSTALGCDLSVTARGSDGAILSLWISDAGLYDRAFYLQSIDKYLDTDMSDALKLILRCALSSEALGLDAAARGGLAAVPLIGNRKSSVSDVNFFNDRRETVGGAVMEIRKGVYTAGAGGNASIVTLTFAPRDTDAAPRDDLPAPQAESGARTAASPTKRRRQASVPASAATEAPEAALRELLFDPIRLGAGQSFAVYGAPSADAWRGAAGKALVSTDGEVWAAGRDGQWLLILYEVNQGSFRVGYIDGRAVRGALPDLRELSFAAIPATVVKDAALTDDPMLAERVIRTLRAGEQVTLLASWCAWAYVETQADGQPVRAFVPRLHLDR